MGDLVDQKYRGRWWAKRRTILSFIFVLMSIIAAFILQYFQNNGLETKGFILFFMIAFLARINSIKIIIHQYEPKQKKQKIKSQYKFKNFIKKLKKTNFGNFTLFMSIFATVSGITSPLIAIYMLRELNLSYIIYILAILSGTFFSVITLNLWGKISDKIGNARVIAITMLIIPFDPLLWILSTSPIYLVIVPGLIGGTMWATFLMASGNFIYDNIKKSNIGKAISYYSMLSGVGAIIGGILSAVLLKIIPKTNIFGITFTTVTLMFLMGTILRVIVVSIFIPKLKEIRHKKSIKGVKELEHLILKETRPALTEDFHNISAIPGYIKEK